LVAGPWLPAAATTVEMFQLSGDTKEATQQITNALTVAGWSFDRTLVGDKGLYVNNANAAITSPPFAQVVTNIQFLGFGSASCTRTFTVQALDVQGKACGEVRTIAATDYPRDATGPFTSVAFDASWNAHGFRLASAAGAQNCYFHAVRVVFAGEDGKPVLRGLSATNVTENGFTACWEAVPEATTYRLVTWRRDWVGGTAGEVVWCDGFTRAPAGAANVSAISEDDFNGVIADETPWNIARVYPSMIAGCVRLGTGEVRGWMVSPPLPACADAFVRVQARRYSAADGRHMPIERICNDVTNDVGSIELGLERTEAHLPLPDWRTGERLVFHSVTNVKSARVVVDEVALVSGYRPATQAWIQVTSAEVGAPETTCCVMGLETGEVAYAVTALDATGVVLCAATNHVTLAPQERPGEEEDVFGPFILRRHGMVYEQDFDGLSMWYPKDKTVLAWTNGVTLAHWALYQKGEPYTGRLSKNPGTGTVAQWYANYFETDTRDDFALGCKTSDGVRDFAAILCLSNATGLVLSRIGVSYTGRQFSYANEEAQTVTVAYRTTTEMLPPACTGDWIPVEELTFTSPVVGNPPGFEPGVGTPPATELPIVSLEEIRLKPDETLLLRWRREGAANAAVLAIDDVYVTCAPAPQPTVITVR